MVAFQYSALQEKTEPIFPLLFGLTANWLTGWQAKYGWVLNSLATGLISLQYYNNVFQLAFPKKSLFYDMY